MSDYYDRESKPISFEEYIRLARKNPEYYRVALTDLGPVRVSTIWLGLDHSFGDGPPLIFETMVFDNEESIQEPASQELLDLLPENLKDSKFAKGGYTYHAELTEYSNRHATEAEAKAYHEETVKTLTELFAVTEEALQQLTEQDNQ